MHLFKRTCLFLSFVVVSLHANAGVSNPALSIDRSLSTSSQVTQQPANTQTGKQVNTQDSTNVKNNAQTRYGNVTNPNDPNVMSQQGVTGQTPYPPQSSDYAFNLKSDVFGANLFTGTFAKQGAQQFNPDYVVTVGDQVQVKLWGAFDFDQQLVVDPKGNIFLPFVGPVRVQGMRNQDLQAHVGAAVAQQFKSNVKSYASLSAAQPVRIYVGGFVNRPGLYNGTSMDSLLHYLDQAGGIDVNRGSFLSVQVKRGKNIRSTANLYDFLLDGVMPIVQLADGDVIFVGPRQNIVQVSGIADNPKLFEFNEQNQSVGDLIKIARPQASATHVRITRNSGIVKNVEYFPIETSTNIKLKNGDAIEFTADKRPGTITVRVQGEHQSQQEYVLPYGSKIKDVLSNIQFTDRSEKESVQLFRTSVKLRQKQQLETSLRTLESTALTARSETDGEATIRKADAELILQWIALAKDIEPLGQVAIANTENMNNLLLENGDILNVPTKDGLVLIGGEVLFPNAIAYDKSLTLSDYINKAGGYTQNADVSRIIVAKRDGTYFEAEDGSGLFGFLSKETQIATGDQILILPKVDVKSRQIFKDVAQILSQLAITARIVFWNN